MSAQGRRGELAVSVVIPTYRRDELLRRCLRGVLKQDLGEPFEVIVVDDGRSPATQATVDSLEESARGCVSVRVIEGRGRGPATARNLGWGAARAPLVAFIDDDAYPVNAEWLRTGVARFADASVNGVSGRVIVPLPERATDFQRNVQNLERGVFVTCNAFYRRAALEAVGGFDERFEVPFREDADLQFRVDRAVGGLVREPSAMIIHPAPRGRFGESLRRQRYSLYNALLYKKHPQRYRAEIQSLPPLNYYAMTVLAVGAAASLLSGRWRPAQALFAAWLALDGAFFARRMRGTSRAPVHILDMALTSALIPFVSIYWRLRGAWRFRTLFA